MAYKEKKWYLPEPDTVLEEQLVAEIGCSPILGRLLVNRGIKTPEEARRFLNPTPFDFHNPFLLKDMVKAVDRIRMALGTKEKILVFGDRDIDGITSVALMVRTLGSLGGLVRYYIPATEGYGLNIPTIEKAIKDDVTLIITVDCGISNINEVAFAREKGLDVIITDHHNPPQVLPAALAIINPKQKDCSYPFKDLAGCSVAFKVLEALVYSEETIFHYNQEVVVLDLETTGLNAQEDEIIEIGAVKLRNDIVIDEFQTLIKPENKIPLGATAINGITNEMVSKAPRLAKVLPDFLRFIDETVLVAHNADFDLGFLKDKAKKLLNRNITNSVIDTLSQSRTVFPLISHSLDSVSKKLELNISPNHRALSDTLAAKDVYIKLRDIIQPRIKHFIQDNLDLLTLGTIGDIVPLRDENRVIVKHGLSCLADTNKVGLKVLLGECSDIENNLTAKTVSWSITPLLNAAGRMGKANLGADLLITQDKESAQKLVEEIIALNQGRKALQAENLKHIMPLVPQQVDLDKDKIIILATDRIEHGVTGIVASQIVRQFYRPVIILIESKEEAMGAARSIDKFDITEALSRCGDLLTKFGGHKGAAGLSLPKTNIAQFRQRMIQIADEMLAYDDLVPLLVVEAELDIKQISPALIKELDQLEPYGFSNPGPIFVLRGVQVASHSKVGKEKTHLRLDLSKDDNFIGAVGWNMAELGDSVISKSDRLDIAFQLEINQWQGRESVRLVLQDIKPQESPIKARNNDYMIIEGEK
jgi:single-stranded-DNA-specific exonuclease